MEVEFTGVMCVCVCIRIHIHIHIYFLYFVFSKIPSMSMHCFCDLRRHSFPKSLATNYTLKLLAYCHSPYSRLGFGGKATAKYTDVWSNSQLLGFSIRCF